MQYTSPCDTHSECDYATRIPQQNPIRGAAAVNGFSLAHIFFFTLIANSTCKHVSLTKTQQLSYTTEMKKQNIPVSLI